MLLCDCKRRYYDWVPSTPSPTPPALNPATIASCAGNPVLSSGGLHTNFGNPSMSGARLDYVANIDVKDRRANASAPGRKVGLACMQVLQVMQVRRVTSRGLLQVT